MKKLIVFLASVALCCLLAFIVTACADGGGTGDIYHTEITLSADENGTALSWEPVKGVNFSVFRAPSRLGEYSQVAERVEDGRYSDGTRFNYYRLVARDNKSGETLRTFDAMGEELQLFGENTYIFSPDDAYLSVNRVIDNIYKKQYGAEFTSERYAAFFKSGEYDNNIALKQGYYTTYAGLGLSPEDVSMRTLTCTNGANGNALINFWRGAENLSFRNSVNWAVSQSAYLRRVKVTGALNLHDSGGYASGGFLADSVITEGVNSGSQQQYFSRNCEWKSWSGQVWNMCFSGVNNPPAGNYPDAKYTVAESTPRSCEKPFLVFKDNSYQIALPAERENSVGVSWAAGTQYIAMKDIYFARADRDTAGTINAALESGKSVVLSAGVYELSSPIEVKRDNAVLLGTGLATLNSAGGNACLKVTGSNVSVAGILFEAGNVKSDSLADIGTDGGSAKNARLYDCFFRVGGFYKGSTNVDTCLNIFAVGTVLDNIWLWRADHGSGVGWTVNNGDTGLCVSADNVTAYGLFSEHFKKNNVLWKGDRGEVIFYQSEIAYDVPSQSEWIDGGRKGYASFKISDGVQSFKGRGMGAYCHFLNAGIELESGFQVPLSAGIDLAHICTVALSGNGGILNVVNDRGGAVNGANNTRFLTEWEL